MNDGYKIVRDPIHGNIKLSGLFLELLDTLEIQRLYNIKQLGFAHLVFPGAHHTRLEHSLGAYKIASDLALNLGLDDTEQELIQCAAMLHDIGHGPFSHTLEALILDRFKVDHVDITEKLITGEYHIYEETEKKLIPQSRTVNELLDDSNINKKKLVNIIRGDVSNRNYLYQMLNSSIDIDQLDYLMRDAYYTGVAYGMIDIDRLMQTMTIYNDQLMIQRKGVTVVENILMARSLMYSSVYLHKTVRIAELMLSKALEFLPDPEPLRFFRLTDGEILNELKKQGAYQYEIVTRLKYRKLFKQSYMLSRHECNEEMLQLITKLENPNTRREKEELLEEHFHIPPGHVIIDVPLPELSRSEPRLHKTDISILEDNKPCSLDEFTPVAKAVRSRDAPDWILMVITDERYRDVLSKSIEKHLLD
ncbi:MAG: HD domain-containing protein [Candidatus Thermoplasmatota archaeon]